LDENDYLVVEGEDGSGRRKRRRRRRSRGRRRPDGSPEVEETGGEVEAKPRRQVVELDSAPVNTPSSGRNPWKKRSSRARRSTPGSVASRRRRLSRVQLRTLTDWLGKLPDNLIAQLYRGLGGQPRRVPSADRMLQLAVRAIAQGNRLEVLVRGLHDRDRNALACLLQCGGVAHAEELVRELMLTYGGSDREWRRSMLALSERGIVFAASQHDENFFYVVPDPLIDGLLEGLTAEMALPTFDHRDMRVIEHKPFAPPLDFSITSLATYIAQHGVRLTQRHDVQKSHKEQLDAFFDQLWEPDSELFQFHLDFLMMHGMVRLHGDHLTLDREVMEEWLQLEPEDQRDLVFRALERRFEMAEWVLWAVHGAGGSWVGERSLSTLYRHWRRGRDWKNRLKAGAFSSGRTAEREGWSFSPLVQCGLLEMGQWGQEKFYRLTPRAEALLDPPEDEGFRQFYLTPDFKMMAPAGLAPVLLFRMGELSELISIDRANTFRITEQTIESALANGWSRDDVLQFLRDNSQLGLPENVEQTIKGWIGHRGDVEFHDLLLITVHRSQIRRLEGHRRIKPYLLHRFAPGMYAVDRSKKDEIAHLLHDLGFSPVPDARLYPGKPEAVEARAQLHRLLGEARDAAADPAEREGGLVEPSQLGLTPGVRASDTNEPDVAPVVTPQQARAILDEAMSQDLAVEMVYRAKTGSVMTVIVRPERLAFKGESPVLVGLDIGEKERRTFVLDQIERLRIQETDDG
jgi:hypothetical protein